MTAAVPMRSGGLGTGGTTSRGVGKGVVAPSLKASRRAGPRLDFGVAMVRAGMNSLDAEPQPTGMTMYCSPRTLKLIGTASMAEPVWIDHTLRAVSPA